MWNYQVGVSFGSNGRGNRQDYQVNISLWNKSQSIRQDFQLGLPLESKVLFECKGECIRQNYEYKFHLKVKAEIIRREGYKCYQLEHSNWNTIWISRQAYHCWSPTMECVFNVAYLCLKGLSKVISCQSKWMCFIEIFIKISYLLV